ncbi:hypothetical protein [Streptomyces sp. NPDC058326]|uniref:hypothetical protein n=1 Tax=Streptomyces sp. NPDC058326 TaxID=3346447 RepID=UPI0036EDFB8C
MTGSAAVVEEEEEVAAADGFDALGQVVEDGPDPGPVGRGGEERAEALGFGEGGDVPGAAVAEDGGQAVEFASPVGGFPVSVPPPPQATNRGTPPATAAATAVEARKPLRLCPESLRLGVDLREPGETAFGVIASTLHGTRQDIRRPSRCRPAAVVEVVRAGRSPGRRRRSS